MASKPAVAPEHADFPQVSAQELAGLLKKGEKVVVLDVRGPEEVVAGTIKGAVNVLAKDVKAEDGDFAKVDAFIDEHLQGASKVAVHCFGCMGRGPVSAKALKARMEARGLQGPEVTYITGGIAAFMDEFSGDEQLADLPGGVWDPVKH